MSYLSLITLQNTEELAKWLGAKFYISSYKAVPIQEFLVYENKIYPTTASESEPEVLISSSATESPRSLREGTKAVRVIEPSKHPELKKHSKNTIVSLALETVTTGYGVLVFCSSRAGCQTTAELISRAMPMDITPEILEQRKEILNSLKCLMLPVDTVLEPIILCGVAFHRKLTNCFPAHRKLIGRLTYADAGLTTEEREIVADAFDRGVLKVIVATCSLAAGINLPARRVILQEARMGRDFVGPVMLRQMRGRACRKGKDEIGETYVCCQKGDVKEVEHLLEMNIPPVHSCLTSEKRGIKR